MYGLAAISVGFAFLAFLLVDIIGKATPAFTATEIRITVPFSTLDIGSEQEITDEVIANVNFNALLRNAWKRESE